MKKTVFEGMASAIITPMTPEGVDYEALGRFIDFQLDSGINALVAVGTTGESATLEPWEQKEVIRFTVQRVAGRVPVIAGTGTNNTSHVIANTKAACEAGADAVACESVAEGVDKAIELAGQDGVVLCFGSLYSIGAIRDALLQRQK